MPDSNTPKSIGRRDFEERRGKENTISSDIEYLESAQQERETIARKHIGNLVESQEKTNLTANRIENEVDPRTFTIVISEDDYAMYKKALENNNKPALDFLTTKLFKIGGKQAIEVLSQAIFSDYFINPESKFSEQTLQQVSSAFLGAVEENCNLVFDVNNIVKGIRAEKEEVLNDEQKEAAVARILDNLPEKYIQNIKPDETSHHANASALDSQQKTR